MVVHVILYVVLTEDCAAAAIDIATICSATGIKPTKTADDDYSTSIPTDISLPKTTGRGGSSSPSPTGGSSSSDGSSVSSSSHSGGLPTAAIAGIGAGGGVIVILIAVIVFLVCRRKRKVPQLVATQTEALLPPSQHQPPSPLSSPSPGMQYTTAASISPLTNAASPSPYMAENHQQQQRLGMPPGIAGGISPVPTPPPTQKQYEPAVLVHEIGASTYSSPGTTEPVFEMPAGDVRPVGSSHGEMPVSEMGVSKAN